MKNKFLKLLLLTSIFLAPYKISIAEVDLSSENKKIIHEDIGSDVDTAILNGKINVLLNSTNEFLHNQDEKNNFLTVKDDFLNQKDNFIKMLKIVGKSSTSNGRKIKAEFDVYMEKIRKYLVEKKVIKDNTEILKELSYPKILVTYNTKDKNETLYSKWAVSRANSYFTSQNIKIVDEETVKSLKKDDSKAIGHISQNQDIAIQTDSEIYIIINMTLSEIEKSGNFTFVNGKVYLEAYESSDSEPFIKKEYKLINKDGEDEAFSVEASQDLSKKVVVESIMSKIMPEMTKDIIISWKDAIKNGRKYVLEFKKLNQSEIEEIINSIKDLSSETNVSSNLVFIRSKSNIDNITDAIESNFGDKLKLSFSNPIKATFEKK